MKQRIGTIIDPYMLDPNDPYFKQDRSNYRKVLTTKVPRITIVRPRIIRKDNLMANKKSTTKLTKLQGLSLLILSITAVVGICEMLGGQLGDAVAGAVIVFLLLVEFIDVKF